MSKAPTQQGLTFSIQDYLKSIYELTASGDAASTSALSAKLGISAASVTGMIQKLAALRPALVIYKKHHGVRLTRRGRHAALEVIRHHRLLEAWLAKSLGYSWDEVHSEAEILEHAVSDHLERRIARALGNPDRDPHGEPIPTEELQMPADASFPLTELRPGEEAVIRRVRADSGGRLRQLQELGLVIGAHVRIVEGGPRGMPLQVRVGHNRKRIRLERSTVRSLYVESAEPTGKL
jgi:DtxR family transcriptional regulator, Mn-dependent transcriptional regulator